MEDKYDVVIIGSGLGGLECGLILSKEGYKVCILEQSEVYGGSLQSFCRKGRAIDTAIHYVGSMEEGQILHQYLKYFGVIDKLSIVKLDNDFDIIDISGVGTYSYMKGYEAFISNLTKDFPTQKTGLEKYCNKIREIGSSINVDVHKSGRLSLGYTDSLGLSVDEFIKSCVYDPILQNILAGTNALYGGIREKSNLYHHAMINHSNIECSVRFVGGTQKIADLLVSEIESNGGKLLKGAKVVSINANIDNVEFVELDKGQRIYGKYFISSIHPTNTFKMLSSTPVVRKAYKSRLSLLPNTYGLFSVCLIMKPQSFPYINKNIYYYYSKDVWDTVLVEPTLKPKMVMLSTQLSEKDSQFSEVVNLISPISSTVFEKWKDTTLNNRGSQYNDLKNIIENNIIDFAEQRYPHLRENIEYICSASPLTYEHYTGTPQGSAYGILKSYKNAIATLIPVRTKLKNMYLTGQNMNVHGALGVTMTASDTCSELLGRKYLAQKIGKA